MAETFVLISGACHGGWTWRLVAEHLRAAGHRVLAPTLPGLEDGDDPERYSLADVSDFIVDLVEREDLRDVTMVGHSWGGYPLTGAAHRLAPRLRKLVYWSAFVPAEGTPLLGEVPRTTPRCSPRSRQRPETASSSPSRCSVPHSCRTPTRPPSV